MNQEIQEEMAQVDFLMFGWKFHRMTQVLSVTSDDTS